MKYPTAPSGSNPVPSKGAPKPTNASIAPATSRGQFPIATGPLRSPNSHPMKTMPLSKRHSIPDQRCYGEAPGGLPTYPQDWLVTRDEGGGAKGSAFPPPGPGQIG